MKTFTVVVIGIDNNEIEALQKEYKGNSFPDVLETVAAMLAHVNNEKLIAVTVRRQP